MKARGRVAPSRHNSGAMAPYRAFWGQVKSTRASDTASASARLADPSRTIQVKTIQVKTIRVGRSESDDPSRTIRIGRAESQAEWDNSSWTIRFGRSESVCQCVGA